MNSIVSANGVSCSIDDADQQRTILSQVHLELQRGASYALVGPNASGKTTLLRMFFGDFDTPNSAFHVHPAVQRDPDFWPAGKAPRGVRFLRQTPTLIPWYSIQQNVALARRWAGVSDPLISDDWLLERLELSQKYWVAHPSALSGGIRQRAALAQVLAAEPHVVFLDEPASAADVRGAELVDAAIGGYKVALHESGVDITLVQATHNLHSAILSADQLLLLLPSFRPGLVQRAQLAANSVLRQCEVDRITAALGRAFADLRVFLSKKATIERERTASEVWVMGLEAAREYSDPSFFACVSENVSRGVKYRYLFPVDDTNARELIKRLSTACGELAVKQHVTLASAENRQIAEAGWDCTLLIASDQPVEGWSFPLPYNYDLILPLKGAELEGTYTYVRRLLFAGDLR